MISSVRNIFNSEDLPGEIAIKPLKFYHTFFAQKINESSGLVKIAWVTTNIATGIFAYPLFGTMALVGVAISLIGIPSLRDHNKEQLTSITHNARISTMGENNSTFSTRSVFEGGCVMKMIDEFRVTPENHAAQFVEISDAVEKSNQQMKKVFLQLQGSFQQGDGEMIIRLCVRSPIEKF